MNMEAILKVVAWPISFIILGIIFLLLFRKQIIDLLKRIKKVGPKGLEVSTEQSQKIVEPQRSSQAEELMGVTDSLILKNQEDRIGKDIMDQYLNGEDLKKVLVRHLAIFQILFYFEQINNAIWGTQIQLLEELNTKPVGETKDDLKRFYDYGASLYPTTYEKYAFENYLYYLTESQLITEKEGRYFITQLGREFLVYLVSSGKTKLRIL